MKDVIVIDSLGAPPEPKWRGPKEAVLAPRTGDGPEHHRWELFGTKADHVAPVTYFLWGCRQCGSRTVSECASKDAPFMADQCPPGRADLEHSRVDENCLQATVDGVHRR